MNDCAPTKMVPVVSVYVRRIITECNTFKANVLDVEDVAAAQYKAFAKDRRVEPRELPVLQHMLEGADGYSGNSPYPWFANPGHACYLNSVVRCLFHLGPARNYVRDLVPTNAVGVELQKLLSAYVDGVRGEGQPGPRHWDVLVPHDLL